MRNLTVSAMISSRKRKNKRTCEVRAAERRTRPLYVRFRRPLKFSSRQIIRRGVVVSGRKAHAPPPAARSLLSQPLPNGSGKKSALEKQTLHSVCVCVCVYSVAAGRVKQSACSQNSGARHQLLSFAWGGHTICHCPLDGRMDTAAGERKSNANTLQFIFAEWRNTQTMGRFSSVLLASLVKEDSLMPHFKGFGVGCASQRIL
jgi:hypothetical protein